MRFTRISIKNPVFATMMMAAFLVLGLFSHQRLAVEQFPDINFPVVAELKKRLPDGVTLEVLRDTSRGIRNSVNNVKHTLLEGAALTILVVFLFLNSWRSTAITGLTLPISLIGTLLVMYAAGFTVNMLTLMTTTISIVAVFLPVGLMRGIITSTLLTLVVVPVIYTYLDDLARWAQSTFGSGQRADSPGSGRDTRDPA